MTTDICYLDATEIAARIAAGELSAVEVTGAYLDRIAQVDPSINAFVQVNDGARAEAEAADAAVARGDDLGPLHGVPVTIKDCFDVAGFVSSRGSNLFLDHRPDADATPVARLREAGAVLLGISNMPEFALWWESDNVPHGRTVNPWNPARIPGGSSGGEAAALAAGMTALGLGSDVAASVRIPAAYCGVVGLKATHGRIPLTGHWPDCLLPYMHPGPMARTVRDAALGLGVMAGPDGIDPWAQPVPLGDLPTSGEGLPRLRVGWSADGGAAPVDPAVRRVVAEAAAALAELGCEVSETTIPALDDGNWQQASMVLYGSEGGDFLRPRVAGRENELSENIQRRLSLAPPSLDAYLAAVRQCEDLRLDVAAFFRDYDMLLGPCTPVPAFEHGAETLTIDGQTVPVRHTVATTVPWNVTGSPALTQPFGISDDGLPIGIQLVGRRFDEATILHAGMVLEQVSPMAGRRPPI
jgi:Asp-tRNA(Asn)/Glu-tRNA(Gln) amidotransferase A subunit family amidase